MSTKFRKKRPVYTVRGTALDQETIIRQRSLIEDYVKTDMKKTFRKTSVTWNMNKDGNFDFSIDFYD